MIYPIIMKQMKFLKSLLIYFILTGVIACNKYANNVPHLGENKVSIENIMFDWDSCEVDIFYTGGQGNFFMKDSIISFASHSQAKIYNYDCSNFELITSHFGFGNGPDELLRFFYATPIMNDTSFFIINNNMDVTLYNNQFKLDKKGPLDFQWGKSQIGAYDSPSVYNFMLRTDFGANIYKYKDKIILPLQPVLHYVTSDERVNKKHFKKSHILGILNDETMMIEEVFGHYPPVYKENMLPQFNFFSYTFDDDIFFVDFPVDSLIYAYKYPDKILHSFGFECKDIERNYKSSHMLSDELYADMRQNGMNTEIVNFSDQGLLFRTYISNMNNTESGMQIYDNTTFDLLADIKVPFSFKLLGHHNSYFYGVTMLPRETDNNTYVTFYKIKLTLS